PPVVTTQSTKIQHVVGPLSPNNHGHGDLGLTNAARKTRIGLTQAEAGFAYQVRRLEIGILVHRETPWIWPVSDPWVVDNLVGIHTMSPRTLPGACLCMKLWSHRTNFRLIRQPTVTFLCSATS